MVLNVTFSNRSVLLVEETRVPGESHRPVGRKSLTNFITYCCMSTPRYERGLISQL